MKTHDEDTMLNAITILSNRHGLAREHIEAMKVLGDAVSELVTLRYEIKALRHLHQTPQEILPGEAL